MILRLSLALATLAAPALGETQLSSQVAGLQIVALDSLPAAPGDAAPPEFCDHLTLPNPETPAGRAVQAQGWSVTSEVPFGDLTAVSFVGGFVPATSGTCELLDGNVGLFSGDRIVALIYGTKGAGPLIGYASPFGDDGVRILSGDLLPGPTADLGRIGSDGIAVTPLAKVEPFCGGAASVPYIYNLPIDQARILLMEAGWQPVPGDRETEGMGFASAIAAAGVPEVEECSGTGFGFCAYGYTRPAGDLSVTTAGEGGEDGGLPTVSGYGVDCR
ncbi:hypothetical protein [Tabrizicola sp.]|uniref:hypothetical protein n=1 Tax=Tabrizicola sp. TaxID=2005166 RepID=UPI003F2B4BAD